MICELSKRNFCGPSKVAPFKHNILTPLAPPMPLVDHVVQGTIPASSLSPTTRCEDLPLSKKGSDAPSCGEIFNEHSVAKDSSCLEEFVPITPFYQKAPPFPTSDTNQKEAKRVEREFNRVMGPNIDLAAYDWPALQHTWVSRPVYMKDKFLHDVRYAEDLFIPPEEYEQIARRMKKREDGRLKQRDATESTRDEE
eukprot:CAMPEP_0117438294 /NCGR_PEP_ID=MMETSP0759-20121206/1979_1 /TAXON_ID=63605 /ORGANISM="Percolomonas cosmopolitus, Strain WS" /LENGTH=195 /DNA_ID=CAMNT_0005229981 /DNA_START=380 /DNA_END=967 /DNA_ORIENTATION=+